MQPRPGAKEKELEEEVYETPGPLPFAKAADVRLADNDLVLGVVTRGQAWAFPVRYLALTDIVNTQLAKLPVAATW